ncbi:MAG TPA: RDD family protein, partial [Candidatus Lustribacter sp.]|nr:RDD family protein [Candidatus Lustribacter sp.]
ASTARPAVGYEPSTPCCTAISAQPWTATRSSYMVMNVKVLRSQDGQLPGFGPSFMRWLIPAAANAVCGLGIVVYLSPLFDNSGRVQGWHDKAANTLVVSTK